MDTNAPVRKDGQGKTVMVKIQFQIVQELEPYVSYGRAVNREIFSIPIRNDQRGFDYESGSILTYRMRYDAGPYAAQNLREGGANISGHLCVNFLFC